MTSAHRRFSRATRVADLVSLYRLAALALATVLLGSMAGCSRGLEPDADREPSVQMSDDDNTRIVTHAFGEVEVPANPQRVAVGHPLLDLDPLLALGIEPVGGTTYDDRTFSLPSYLADDVAHSFTSIGTPQSPNLEALIELEPDVIVAAANDIGNIYAQLSEIAPVIAFYWEQPRWKEYLSLLAASLGRDDEAAEVLEAYRRQVSEFAALVGDPSEITVSVVRARPDGLRAILANSFSGSVLADVGFARPPSQQRVGELPFADVSLERAIELDGDVMFVWGALEGADERFDEIRQSGIWQQLDVVRRANVYDVEEEHWFVGGPLAAQRILDDLRLPFAEE